MQKNVNFMHVITLRKKIGSPRICGLPVYVVFILFRRLNCDCR